MSDELFNRTQQFQQAIDTTITCRSIVKYNSTLSEVQKTEILAGIDATLGFLAERLTAHASIESMTSHKLADLLNVDALDEIEIGYKLGGQEDRLEDVQSQEDLSLKNLYRVYHNYLSTEQLVDLETRYRMVMGVLEQLEEVARGQHDTTSGDLTSEGMLHRIRGFVTAIYCIYREFATVLSNLVEGKDIDTDTETLAQVNQYASEAGSVQMLRDISPLIHVYAEHLRLQGHHGLLTRSTGDAIAFLVFLEESLEPMYARRGEIVIQLKAVAGLLTDLTRLLTEYEQVMSVLSEA